MLLWKPETVLGSAVIALLAPPLFGKATGSRIVAARRLRGPWLSIVQIGRLECGWIPQRSALEDFRLTLLLRDGDSSAGTLKEYGFEGVWGTLLVTFANARN